MAKDGHWMEKAFANAHGQLRSKLGAKEGKPISLGALRKAAATGSTKTKRQAQLVMNAHG